MMWHSHRHCHLRIASEISCDHVTTCVTSQSSGYSATVYMGGGAIWTGRSLSIPLWQLGHILFHALPLIKIIRIPTKSRWAGDGNKSPSSSLYKFTPFCYQRHFRIIQQLSFGGKVIEDQKPKVENWPVCKDCNALFSQKRPLPRHAWLKLNVTNQHDLHS